MTGVPIDRRREGAGDVVDMDAIADLSRFDDPARRAAAQVIEHAALRPINASQAKDFHARAAVLRKAEPGVFGLEPAQASLRGGPRGALLIDPRPLPIAVHAHARQVADPSEL